jgi:Spy/CpxP family protein refolding chaperone
MGGNRPPGSEIIKREKTMKKVVLGIVAAVVLVTGVIFVVAQRAAHHRHGAFGPGGHMIGMMLRGLDLTGEQKDKVKEIVLAGKANIGLLAGQLREGRRTLSALGTDGTFDQAKVQAIAADQAGIMTKLIVEREKTKAQVFALLTDAQRAKAIEIQQKFQDRIKEKTGVGAERAELDEF